MSQVIEEKPTDAVVLGLGAMGGDIATKLTLAGVKTVGIEKGPYWDFQKDFAPVKYDEWGIAWMRKFDHSLTVSTFSIRNNSTQMALPVRRNTLGQIHTLGNGVGGATQHYGGQMGRFGPWVYQMKSSTVSRYGQAFLDAAVPHEDIFDFPVTYEDLLPYYKDWEMAWGVNGTDQQPFYPDSVYPKPPQPPTPGGQAFTEAAGARGVTPQPMAGAPATKPFTNQYGVQVNACVYDGWCGEGCNFVCETGAKANPAFRTVPAAIKTGNLDMRLNSYVFRLDTDSSGRVTAARYYDSEGNVHVQPASVFVSTIWGFNTVRLMLISKIGNAYNPTTVSGSLGRGIAQPTGAPGRNVTGTLNIGANAYPSGNSQGGGIHILDLADDNFDHTGKNYIGGSRVIVGQYAGGGPGCLGIATNASPANVGSAFKAKQKDVFIPPKTMLTLSGAGNCPPVTDYYVDLDPHYDDIYGDPLARQTLDNLANGTNCANDQAPLYEAILNKMGASNVTVAQPAAPLSVHVNNWSHHTRGGARIGTDPTLSVFNKWGQCWTSQNLFAVGEITEPVGSCTETGGTHPAGALALLTADGIQKYLASPGLLA